MDDPKKPSERAHHSNKNQRSEKPLSGGSQAPHSSQVILSKTEYETMKTELEKAQKGCESNLDGWQRERAEFSNYKKRIDREQAQLSQSVTGNVIKKYLIILDDLELALKNAPSDAEGSAWAAGIELIARKLYSIIEAEGIERINENRVQFDPTIHEAISHEDQPDFESGDVIEVLRQGYKLGDRVLRPAMVRVAR